MHTEHVHCPPAGFGGGCIPAAAQLKPPWDGAGLGLSVLGASHTVHLSPDVVFWSMHTEHVHDSPAGFGGGFIPAALQSKPPDVGLAWAAGAGAFVKSKVGSEDTGAALAISRAFSVLGPAPGEDSGSVNVYVGSSSWRMAAT